MKTFETRIYNYIQEHNLVRPGMRVLIGVSGGADSVCLLRVMKTLAGTLKLPENGLAAVHVHHGIRGAEADRDAAFTKALCEELGIPFYLYKKDVPAYARERGMSVEEAGREYRYQCMEELAERIGCDRIAVAHNQDDMAETVIFHMIRGAGLKGLAGIAAGRDRIIRPLLAAPRTEIERYLEELGQPFCRDSTNDDPSYARNRIRHSILPVMKELNDRAVEHICRMAQDAEQSYAYIHAQAMERIQVHEDADAPGRTVTLSISQLEKLAPVLREHAVSEAIAQAAARRKDISRSHIRAVAALIGQDTGSMVYLPYGIRAHRSYDRLIITDKTEETPDYRIPIEAPGDYEIPNMGRLSVEIGPCPKLSGIPKKNYTKLLNYDKIKGDLCIRTPKTGDSIVIDAAGSTKKLSRVFTDEKVDRNLRAGWPVLACGQEIIWVIGLRFSPAYYIGPDTEYVMKLQYYKRDEKGERYGTKD